METLTLINVILLCSIIFLLILYPIVVFVVIKRQFVPSIVSDLVNDSLRKVDRFVDKQLEKTVSEFEKVYSGIRADVNIIRVKTINDLNLIIAENTDKLINTLESARVGIDFV